MLFHLDLHHTSVHSRPSTFHFLKGRRKTQTCRNHLLQSQLILADSMPSSYHSTQTLEHGHCQPCHLCRYPVLQQRLYFHCQILTPPLRSYHSMQGLGEMYHVEPTQTCRLCNDIRLRGPWTHCSWELQSPPYTRQMTVILIGSMTDMTDSLRSRTKSPSIDESSPYF